jgi:hypothetical protein
MPHFWDWLIHTDAGLLTRIGFGAAAFVTLAIVDLRRHGPRATRWREYLFLIAAAAVAMVYGAVNDTITSQISWEYFYYGKGLSQVLGPKTPPAPLVLSCAAAKVGMKAAWSGGLIAAAAILIANNPKRGLPQLPNRRLPRFLPGILVWCVACGILFGIAGGRGGLAGISADFGEMVRHDELRPYRFMTAFGVHLGAYIGGGIGTIRAVFLVRRARRDTEIQAAEVL